MTRQQLGLLIAPVVILAGSLAACDRTDSPLPPTEQKAASGCTPSAQRPGPFVDLGLQPSTGAGVMPAHQVDTIADDARAAGAAVLSTTVRFAAVQTTPGGPLHLDALDTTAREARERGLKLRVTVYGMPTWAYDHPVDDGSAYTPPRSAHELQHWRALLTALLRHLGTDLDYLEIWNEPNTPRYWSTGPDAAEYVALLRASAPVIRDLAPRARIITGGVGGDDSAWVSALFAASGDDLPFDVLGLHEFGSVHESTKEWMTSYRELHEAAGEAGEHVPAYLTSFGYELGDTVTDRERAVLLRRAFDAFVCTPWLEGVSWYYLHPTPWDSPHDTLVDADARHSATYDALKRWSTARARALR